MLANELLKQGKVRAAQSALSEHLRAHPDDRSARTFLFELLCFSGDWERAQRQLTALGNGRAEQEMGATFYSAALHAERIRHKTAAHSETEGTTARAAAGTLNGESFEEISDADPVIGGKLEVFAAGAYLRIAFADIASLSIAQPRRLRDLLWIPGSIRMNETYHGRELKDVLLPAIYPFTFRLADEHVWLGRETRYVGEGEKEYLAGQKMFLIDDEPVPLLEIRELRFCARPEDSCRN